MRLFAIEFPQVAQYRFELVDAEGAVAAVHHAEFADDDAAIDHADMLAIPI